MPTNTKNLTLPEYRATRDSFVDCNVVAFVYDNGNDNILEAIDGPLAGQFEVVLGNTSTMYSTLAAAEVNLYRTWYLPERANSDEWENALQVRLFDYCARENLPFLSADEILAESPNLTPQQKTWLANYICEWNKTEEALSVNLFAKHHGWHIMDTGGGCTGFARDLPDGGYYLITDDAEAPTTLDTPVTVGRYDADGETIEWVELPTAHDAIVMFGR